MQIEIVERVQSKASESGGSVLRFPGKAGGEIIERFFDISPVPLCVIDGALRFRMVNEAAASIIGLPAASLTGHPVTHIIPKTKTLLDERKSDVSGKSGTVSIDPGGQRKLKK